MREVRRTAIVPHTPAQMYTIVNDVRRYPEFVPWCPATRVFEETETSIHAAVDIARSGVKLSVATRNTMVPGERIDLKLSDGPLRTLEGSWRFVPILERTAPAIPGAVPPGPAAAAATPGTAGGTGLILPADGTATSAGTESPPEGSAPTPRLRGCRVELDIRFDFRNSALTMLFGPVFEASWDSLVDAFVVRARQLHGPGGPGGA